MVTKRKVKRTECRQNRLYKNPDCSWCYYRHDCKGAVVAVKNYYGPENCPDGGNAPQCGAHRECTYCKKH